MKTIKSISPVDGSTYVERPVATAKEIADATESARSAQPGWQALSIAERATYCTAMIDAMLANTDEIAEELAWQMGRPIRYGAGELGGFEERARYMIDIASDALADLDPGEKTGFERYVKREPLGIVLTIAPWNFPFLTTVNSVIPALMAGNAVILKHASNTLKVADRFSEAFSQARLPDSVFQHLVLQHDQTGELISSGNIDMVCFTGSVPAGREMERAAAGQFIPVGLELGGKDPAYVRADCDLEHAIENLADGAFFNSGQSCCGIERIYVHADVYEAFVDGLVSFTNGYVLGNPLDNETTLGPMVKPAAADYVRKQVQAAVAAGAKAHIDTSRFALDQPGSAYMAPQILTDVDHSMSVMRDESFGPVVGIMKVDNDEQAIELMNDSDLGLTAAIWTKDIDAARQIGEQLQTGTVFMNRSDYLDPALAWTGVKCTGRGCTLSSLGYHALTRPKTFHLRTITS
jgi:acyl-CoA reductase-like NAD-dependent aldehyde dehydrogenase